MNTPLNQVSNPTDTQRHEMLRASLESAGRPEDYEYIVNYLSPPPDITNFAAPGELREVKIGIIGGGLAGMCAAFELRKLGADIAILEASKSRIGGRIYTFRFDTEGRYYGEFGALQIPAAHETAWHYINLFGLDTLATTAPKGNNFLYVHNTRLRTKDLAEQILYPKYNLTPKEQNTPLSDLTRYAFEYRFRKLPPGIRSELIRILPEYSPEFAPLMDISLRQNFEKLGLSQGAINLICGTAFGSGTLLHISYDEIAHKEYTLDYINTYRIQNGNVGLPLAFYRTFQSECPPQYSNLPRSSLGTVSYRPGNLVTGIYQSDYRSKVVVKYSSGPEGTDAADIFDYVICSVPLSAMRNIDIKPCFSDMKMRAILELNYIDAQKTLYFCNRRFWERNTDYGDMLGGISFTDLPIQSIIYPGGHNHYQATGLSADTDMSRPPEEPGVLVASYNLGQNSVRLGGLEDFRRYEVIRQNVEEVHGLPRGFLNTIVERYQTVHWNSEPFYLGALSCILPEQKRLFSYELTQAEYNGRVYLAGEHVSPKHGWIQGALYSGKAAANSLADHFHNQY